MLRSVKAQIQGLSKSWISSDKLVPGGRGVSGLVWSGLDSAKIRFGSDWANQKEIKDGLKKFEDETKQIKADVKLVMDDVQVLKMENFREVKR